MGADGARVYIGRYEEAGAPSVRKHRRDLASAQQAFISSLFCRGIIG